MRNHARRGVRDCQQMHRSKQAPCHTRIEPLVAMQRTRSWVGHACGSTRQGRRSRALRRFPRRRPARWFQPSFDRKAGNADARTTKLSSPLSGPGRPTSNAGRSGLAMHSPVSPPHRRREERANPSQSFGNPATSTRYTHSAFHRTWVAARCRAGIEGVSLYEGTKHSFRATTWGASWTNGIAKEAAASSASRIEGPITGSRETGSKSSDYLRFCFGRVVRRRPRAGMCAALPRAGFARDRGLGSTGSKSIRRCSMSTSTTRTRSGAASW